MGGPGSGRPGGWGRRTTEDLPSIRVSDRRRGWGRSLPVTWTTTEGAVQGRRAWWRCPECGRRCTVLYKETDGRVGCRQCFRLAYPSTRESEALRLLRRARRLRRKLWCDPRLGAALYPGRPVRPQTYARLEAAILRAETRAMILLAAKMQREIQQLRKAKR